MSTNTTVEVSVAKPIANLEDSGDPTTDLEEQGSDIGDDEEADLSMLLGGPTASPHTQISQSEELGVFEIFRKECLRCKHLVPTMEKKWNECFWKKGNEFCPASAVQVVQRIPLADIVPRFLTAMKTGDFERLAKLSAKLSEKPDWYQQRVKTSIEEALDAE
jgi:hypothetical protein